MDGAEINGYAIKTTRVERKLTRMEVFDLVGEDLKIKDEVKKNRAEKNPPPPPPKTSPPRHDSPRNSSNPSPKRFPPRPQRWDNERVREVQVQAQAPPPPPVEYTHQPTYFWGSPTPTPVYPAYTPPQGWGYQNEWVRPVQSTPPITNGKGGGKGGKGAGG